VFERPSQPRAPCQGMTVWHNRFWRPSRSCHPPLASVSRSASCSHSKCTNACLKSDATRTSVFPSTISVTIGWRSVVRRVVTDSLTLKMKALQSFETSAADRLTTQHDAPQDASVKLKHCSEYVTLKYTKQYACLPFCVGVELGVSYWGGNTDLRGCWE